MLRIVILAISLLAGGAAAWLAYSLIGSEQTAPAPEQLAEPVTAAEVLVAAAPVGRGEELGPRSLEWSPWPEAAVGEGMILRESQPDAIESYSGWVSRAGLLTGEPVRAERLVQGGGGLMSLILTPGTRAVAVRVSAESGAGGFIMPDDRVDILHTTVRDADGDGTKEPVSTTIMRGIRVLAVDQVVEQGEAGAARVAETATLELTPEQVELLTTARSSGQVSLALRPIRELGETTPYEMVRREARPAPSALPRSEIEENDEHGPVSGQRAGGGGLSAASSAEGRPKLLEVRIIGSGRVETVMVPDGEE